MDAETSILPTTKMEADEAYYYHPHEAQGREAMAYEGEGLPSPATERQKEYLRLLQQRNRALKQFAAKSRSELEQERREKGMM